MIQDKQPHTTEPQLRPACQRVRLVRHQPLIVHPRAVGAGKVHDLVSRSSDPADHGVPPRNTHVVTAQFRKVEQGFRRTCLLRGCARRPVPCQNAGTPAWMCLRHKWQYRRPGSGRRRSALPRSLRRNQLRHSRRFWSLPPDPDAEAFQRSAAVDADNRVTVVLVLTNGAKSFVEVPSHVLHTVFKYRLG
jgi:hypothetical protein